MAMNCYYCGRFTHTDAPPVTHYSSDGPERAGYICDRCLEKADPEGFAKRYGITDEKENQI